MTKRFIQTTAAPAKEEQNPSLHQETHHQPIECFCSFLSTIIALLDRVFGPLFATIGHTLHCVLVVSALMMLLSLFGPDMPPPGPDYTSPPAKFYQNLGSRVTEHHQWGLASQFSYLAMNPTLTDLDKIYWMLGRTLCSPVYMSLLLSLTYIIYRITRFLLYILYCFTRYVIISLARKLSAPKTENPTKRDRGSKDKRWFPGLTQLFTRRGSSPSDDQNTNNQEKGHRRHHDALLDSISSLSDDDDDDATNFTPDSDPDHPNLPSPDIKPCSTPISEKKIWELTEDELLLLPRFHSQGTGRTASLHCENCQRSIR
ncbi:MAG: hypothetical protein LQ352_007841 [Teloschistes flavicans]|nr:MAG: hypothetical protein LQ352_007841 [Teloschistes flavicans]